ncbi:MAG: hypothetical protein OXG24_04655 [Gammaproteobacteria bacterium]|nr:hypothetical protein [Gammaproteobacteria bacterium]
MRKKRREANRPACHSGKAFSVRVADKASLRVDLADGAAVTGQDPSRYVRRHLD